MTVRVMVGGGHVVYRAALIALLNGDRQIQTITESPHVNDAVPAAVRQQPDVLLLAMDGEADIGPAAVSTVTELRRKLPTCRVTLIVGAEQRALLLDALRVQPEGLLDRDAHAAHLIDIVRAVARGERRIHPNLSATAFSLASNPLTEREHDILARVADGGSSGDIARALALAHGTVRNYLSRIVTKTGARTRIDAVRIARDQGWL